MGITQHTVCILTVTYGNRWQFLEQVLKRAAGFKQVVDIIVVDNASVYDVAAKAKTISDKITTITNPENLGSAGGYKMALEYGVNHTNTDLFLLLDDDNVPDDGATSVLLDEWDAIDSDDDKKALFCFRDDRRPHVLIAKGEDPYRFYLVKDNFLGFHLFRIFKNKFYKIRDIYRKDKKDYFKKRAAMPYVPYGGLMLHRQMIGKIGYPDERMFLYVDDSEYTYRITQNGGTIWLIPSCGVTDIDKSQGINYKKRLFHSQLLDEWSFRTYFHVRNRLYFYSRVAIANKFIFRLNKLIYLAWLRIVSMLSNKTAEYKKLVAAVNDGLNGNMGKASPEKF